MSAPICRDPRRLHPVLRRKVMAILRDLAPRMPAGYQLRIFETLRTPARQAALVEAGASKTMKSAHLPHQLPVREEGEEEPTVRAVACACDLVWKYQGRWTWMAPMIDGEDGWAVMRRSARAHGLRLISWDMPHVELPRELW